MEIIAIMIVLLNMVATNDDYSYEVREASRTCSIELSQSLANPYDLKKGE